MSELSKYLRRADGGYQHWCAGCSEAHYIAVDKPLSNGAKWTYDDKPDMPTFSPSINISTPEDKDEDGTVYPATRCHYFIREGTVFYCADSTHKLSGQNVKMSEWPTRSIK